MKRCILITVCVLTMSLAAAGQSVNYGPPGISPTIPILPVASIQVTPPAPTIPLTSSTNPLVLSPSVTTIPTTPAVPPPIEPSPTERMQNALKYAYTSSSTGGSAAGALFNPGVASASKVDDDTQGRSLGEVARERRRCAPEVTGRKFTNDDFGRTPGANAGEGLPKLIVTVCPAN